MAALRTLYAIPLNKARRSPRPESTRSRSEALAQKRTVDHVSRYRMLEILSRSGDRGRHVDTSGASDEDTKGDYHAIMGSWPTIIARSWPLIGPHQIGRPANFARHFLIK